MDDRAPQPHEYSPINLRFIGRDSGLFILILYLKGTSKQFKNSVQLILRNSKVKTRNTYNQGLVRLEHGKAITTSLSLTS
ncbi:hypothetical protein [Mastigocoleus sp. MO_188.B34]|uniref:hypothetical protein n=1 Tax=Mastigocoleus sp. MO_188.B34 TaxID=3036635 RepID=UPI00262A3C4D|nr:hypothetical protein [Mastigocoleus sp. MO_188.B34]